jgi:hypothetical protein
MLEPYERKLSRTVLRGADFGNEISLLGINKMNILAYPAHLVFLS